MESMNFGWLPQQTSSQPLQFSPYDPSSANVLLSPNVDHNVVGPTSTFENTIDVNHFFPGSLEYRFDPSYHGPTEMFPLQPTSASPPAYHPRIDSGAALDEGEPRRGSSEEKDAPGAKSRRKAQNRAAQRAFRDRKERHVRDLEAKLNLLTTTTSSLQSDNERLKLMLQRAQTENEILRTSVSSSSGSKDHTPGFVDDPSLMSQQSRQRSASSNLQVERLRMPNDNLSPDAASFAKGDLPSSESYLLSAGATWDLLQSHPLYLSGELDIGKVYERLKKMARCDGTGPMFREQEVRQIIEEVGRSGCDELDSPLGSVLRRSRTYVGRGVDHIAELCMLNGRRRSKPPTSWRRGPVACYRLRKSHAASRVSPRRYPVGRETKNKQAYGPLIGRHGCWHSFSSTLGMSARSSAFLRLSRWRFPRSMPAYIMQTQQSRT
nr:fluconazole resistance protein 3 [Quercus suber]